MTSVKRPLFPSQPIPPERTCEAKTQRHGSPAGSSAKQDTNDPSGLRPGDQPCNRRVLRTGWAAIMKWVVEVGADATVGWQARSRTRQVCNDRHG
jgi:hypothetical protein